MQQIQIIGHLGREAKSQIHNNREFLTFSVAVSSKWTDSAGVKQETTTWYSVSSRQFALLPHLVKGTQVFIQGSLNARLYNNKSGVTAIDLSVSAEKIQLLSKKESNTDSYAQNAPSPVAIPQTSAPVGVKMDQSDDLPF